MKRTVIAIAIATAVGAPAIAQENPQTIFDRLDQNADGTVSYDELMVEVRSKFDEFDTDRNGLLELAELPAEMPLPERAERRIEKMKQRIEKRRAKMGEDFEPRFSPEELEERMRPTRMKFIARLDTNGDEVVDIDEFGAPMFKRHKRADLNGDGSITRAEVEELQAQRKMRKFRGEKRRQRG